ncbi:hypothetical protein [Ancylobacter sp. FA202]|uniref:hypothetical protein n=1 Tax=Ancylobacter sp. FA202 TaxID=1111106 RepID=UPI00035C5D5B|nr:hypothetical protein [Ancylobacter sp. FA202]
MGKTAKDGRSARRSGAHALLLAGATLLGSLPVAAQTAVPGRTPATVAETSDPACAHFGAGFTRLAGSSTCVKISGSVQTDLYSTDVNSTSRVDALAPGLKSK